METLNIINQLLIKNNIEYSYIMKQEESFYHVNYEIKNYNEVQFSLFEDVIEEIDGYDEWGVTISGDEKHMLDLYILDDEICWQFSFFKSL